MHNEKVLYNLKVPIDNDDNKYFKVNRLLSKKLLLLPIILILIVFIIFSIQYFSGELEVIPSVEPKVNPKVNPEIISGKDKPYPNRCDSGHYGWIYYSSDENSLYICTKDDGWLYMSELYIKK